MCDDDEEDDDDDDDNDDDDDDEDDDDDVPALELKSRAENTVQTFPECTQR